MFTFFGADRLTELRAGFAVELLLERERASDSEVDAFVDRRVLYAMSSLLWRQCAGLRSTSWLATLDTTRTIGLGGGRSHICLSGGVHGLSPVVKDHFINSCGSRDSGDNLQAHDEIIEGTSRFSHLHISVLCGG